MHGDLGVTRLGSGGPGDRLFVLVLLFDLKVECSPPDLAAKACHRTGTQYRKLAPLCYDKSSRFAPRFRVGWCARVHPDTAEVVLRPLFATAV